MPGTPLPPDPPSGDADVIGVDFGTLSDRAVHRPDAGAAAVYDELFADYRALHDYFGRGGTKAMRTLHAVKRRATAHREAKQVTP